ncbi:MAG TPA: helix-hairpin-helix domain-containing protein [Thermodesulfobacteriota bacterium]|nr:helix-hairpin-helix domain-containing protein [Thermodesulfobacteriota bacterium]
MPGKTNRRRGGRNSILYLALLSLVYYVASVYGGDAPYPVRGIKSPGNIYVEVEDQGSAVVHVLKGPSEISEFRAEYGIEKEIKSGVKVVLADGSPAGYGRISGARSISLGVPIGLNSAGPSDLAALPGIGEELAGRIISYREENGGFTSVSELIEVNGIGDKKFAGILGLVSLD